MVSNQTLTWDGITLASSIIVKIFGVSFNQHTSFNTDIEEIFRSAFIHLHKIVKVRNIPPL